MAISIKQAMRHARAPEFARTRCKRCPIKLVHDGYGYRHVDEEFSGQKKHGHYPVPRREWSSNNRTHAKGNSNA